MKFTPHEIVEILSETIEESAKDLMNLEDRRPLVNLTINALFQVMEELSGVPEEKSQFRGIDNRPRIIGNQTIKKLRRTEEIR